MNIVIDTNIFISALIKDSLTRNIIVNLKHNLLFPEFEFAEIKNHKIEIIKKSGLSSKEFDILLLRLLNYVKIIPTHMSSQYKKKAFKIIGKIDPNDVIFIATALAFNALIWSDDKHFKKQKQIKTLTTKGIIWFLKK